MWKFEIPLFIARLIFILCLPVLFFTAAVAWGFNSQWLYSYGFQKYNVSQVTGLSETELDKVGEGFIQYINSGEEYWHITVSTGGTAFELFTQDEQIHFKDVKALVQLDYRALAIVLVLVLAYALTFIFWRRGRYTRPLARSVIWGIGLAILLILALGIASLLDFDQIFMQFHYLVFTNSFWSSEGYMLLLFPGGFWSDIIMIGTGFMAGLALISGAAAFIYLRLSRHQLPVNDESDPRRNG
jgi:integral membrane protein (TIGR01906 family)